MKLHHIALRVSDLDEAAAFWRGHFGAAVGPLYRSQRQAGFTSRFVTLGAAGLRLELMHRPGLSATESALGWAHVALSLGSAAEVDAWAARFAAEGRLMLGPRTTGDGYYEAVIHGPDGLEIELTV